MAGRKTKNQKVLGLKSMDSSTLTNFKDVEQFLEKLYGEWEQKGFTPATFAPSSSPSKKAVMTFILSTGLSEPEKDRLIKQRSHVMCELDYLAYLKKVEDLGKKLGKKKVKVAQLSDNDEGDREIAGLKLARKSRQKVSSGGAEVESQLRPNSKSKLKTTSRGAEVETQLKPVSRSKTKTGLVGK